MNDLSEKARTIKVVLSDVDGVLTDAGMYYTEQGDELKKFSTYDGGGFLLLKLVGIKVGVITSENSVMVDRRVQKLKLDYVIQGAWDKNALFTQFLAEQHLDEKEVAYIGDDINDLLVLKRVGLSATIPQNFLPSDFDVDYRTSRPGGGGALREFAEQILFWRGEHQTVLENYFRYIKSSNG